MTTAATTAVTTAVRGLPEHARASAPLARTGACTAALAMSLVFALAALPARPLVAQDVRGAPRTITVSVVDDAGAPLVHAAIAVQLRRDAEPVARALTDARGTVRVVLVAGDSAFLVVRRLGYRPASTALAMPGSVTVRLARLPQRLAPVAVREAPLRCHAGFVPHDADSTLVAIVDGITAYAQQEAALAAAHPWRLTWRVTTRQLDSDGRLAMPESTIVVQRTSAGDTLGYVRGRMLERRGLRPLKVRRERVRDLAAADFLGAHCFRLAAAPDTALGAPAIRVDFRADRTVRTLDVDGSILLDPVTLVPRKLVFDQVNIPMGFRDGQEVVVLCQLAPGLVLPVERRWWQRYTNALVVQDARIDVSAYASRGETLEWLDTPPPALDGVETAAGCPRLRLQRATPRADADIGPRR